MNIRSTQSYDGVCLVSFISPPPLFFFFFFFFFFYIYQADPPALFWEAPTSDLFPLTSLFFLAVCRQVESILTLNAQGFIASA